MLVMHFDDYDDRIRLMRKMSMMLEMVPKATMTVTLMVIKMS